MSTVRKTISHIERLNNSRNGNPRYRIGFADAATLTSESDAAFAYGVGNPDMREGCEVEMTLTPSGKIRTMRPLS